jgi:acetyl esterase/lipase
MNKPSARPSNQTYSWPENVECPETVCRQEIEYSNPGKYNLDLTYFSRHDSDKLRPAMLFVHGGCWSFGNKAQFYRHAIYLALKYNFFSACISYRFSHIAKYPAALIDCKCAVRWIRSIAKEHKIDTNRIAVCGGSAGAHLSAMTALTPGQARYEKGPYSEFSSDVHLAILFNGHFDLTEQLKEHIQDKSMYDFFGGHPWEIPHVYGEASPILWVNEKSPPMLFLHGELDRYPHKQSIAMAERLDHFGISAEVEIYKGKRHGWFNSEPDCSVTTERLAQFVEKHFQLKERA